MLFFSWDLTGTMLQAGFLLTLLVIIGVIDYRHRIIPNRLLVVGTIAGVVLNLAFGKSGWFQMLLGFAAGGTVLLAVAIVSNGGIGGGDVKLSAMLGVYLGWQEVLQTIFLASVLGAIGGLGLMLAGRANGHTAIPFGPFLAAGTIIQYLWQPLNNWY